MHFNSFVPGRCGNNFKSIILKIIVQNNCLGTCEIALPQSLTYEKSTLVQANMHYFSNFRGTSGRLKFECFDSLWPNSAIWHHRSGSTLTQVRACCLTAPTTTWTNVDFLWMRFCGNHFKAIFIAFAQVTSLYKLGLKRYTGTPVYRGYGGTNMYRDTQKQITKRYGTFVTYTKVRKEHKIPH